MVKRRDKPQFGLSSHEDDDRASSLSSVLRKKNDDLPILLREMSEDKVFAFHQIEQRESRGGERRTEKTIAKCITK